MAKPTDFSTLIPAPERVVQALREVTPGFFRCPNGHRLPHRTAWGRCSPVLCVDRDGLRPPPEEMPSASEDRIRPLGVKRKVVADPHEAERVRAQADEANELIRRQGARAAQEALFPPPPIPVMPDFVKGGRAAMESYIDGMSQYALWKRAFDLRFGSQSESKDAAQEFMDRAGYPRRKEAAPALRAPIIINLGGGPLPWAAGGQTHEAQLAVDALGGGDEEGAAPEGQPGDGGLQPRLPEGSDAARGLDGASDAGDGGEPAPPEAEQR